MVRPKLEVASPPKIMTFNEVITYIVKFIEKYDKNPKNGAHLQVSANKVDNALFKHSEVLKSLMDFIISSNHKISIITFMPSKEKDIIDLYAIVQAFLRHKKYKKQVCHFDLKEEDKSAFEKMMSRTRFNTYISNFNESKYATLILTLGEEGLLITETANNWSVCQCNTTEDQNKAAYFKWYESVLSKQNKPQSKKVLQTTPEFTFNFNGILSFMKSILSL